MKKMAFLFTVLAVFLALSMNVFGAMYPQGKKYALVIGNNNYSQFPRLNGAGKDASAIAENLTELDFTVTLLTNATASQMNNAIEAFAAQLRESPDSQGFFWFSGQGVQSEHIAYLIGTDAENSIERVRTGAVSLWKIFDAISAAKNFMNVVIVDTCFSPIGNSETAVSLEPALLEKLHGNIGYICSTSPGETATDISPFIGSVLKNLNTPADMTLAFSTITSETLTASGNRQRPIFYLPRSTYPTR
jgi:hypothetical protein